MGNPAISGLLTALGAIAFVAVGCLVGIYIGERVIPALYGLIMSKEYRAWKRQREEEAKAHRFWFERVEKIQKELDAEEAERRLEEAMMQDEIQRAELRRQLKKREAE